MPFTTPLISPADLDECIRSDAGVVIVDCRFELSNPSAGRRMYAEGHIPGALYADLDQDLAGPVTASSGRHPLPDRSLFVQKLGDWGIDQDTPVVIYDQGEGAYGVRLWWMLAWLGKDNVALLDGGFARWASECRGVSQAAPAPAKRHFEPRPALVRVVETNELRKALTGDSPPLLVDARGAARFSGEVEPIDSRAGHIPGARNLPFTRHLGPDGRWRSPRELRALWEQTTGQPVGGDWIAMCGSGVTACHLAFAAKIAGNSPPRLYIGSWSEWIRDPGRPIATGNG
jgi:thiosulfate/3-mercaptopyruvate sulfurtransferase